MIRLSRLGALLSLRKPRASGDDPATIEANVDLSE